MAKGGKGGGSGIIKGNKRDNLLDGTSGADLIRGLAGNDTLFGYAGDDTLEGGSGADYLSGGTGADTLFGGSGNDTLLAGAGDDSLDGGDGTDTVTFSGNRDDYTVTRIDAVTVLIAGPDGTDTIANTETFAFADMTQDFAEVLLPRQANLAAGTLNLSSTGVVAGTALTATWDQGSDGVIDAGASTSSVVIATSPDLASVVATLGGAAAGPAATGSSQTLTSGLDTSGLAAGTYWVAVVADDGNQIDESDEGDNVTNWVQITVLDPFRNLTLDSVAVDATGSDFDLNDGAVLDVTTTVTNTGNIGSGTFQIATVLSADAVLSADDFEILSASYTLQPGESVQVGGPGLVDAQYPAGEYYVISYIQSYDGSDDVASDDIVVSAGTVTLVGGTTFGTSGDDFFTGTAADEVFELYAGDDTVIGSEGDDVILGGGGTDTVDYSAITGPLEIYGSFYSTGVPGQVEVNAIDPYNYRIYWQDYLEGVETLIATEFGDAVAIEDGSVRHIQTLGGDDSVIGSYGDDTIEAGDGDDLVGGIGGDDLIFVGAGQDMIFFDRESDGASVVGDGNDVIADFNAAEDIVMIEYDPWNETFDPFANITQTADGALISYAPDSSILLLGVDASLLNAANLMAYEEYINIYY